MIYENQKGTPPTLPNLEQRVDDILMMKSLPADRISSLLDDIKSYAQHNAAKLNTSQLRNIFSKVLGAKELSQLQLIRPKLMYVAARQQDREAKKVVEFFERIITKIKTTNPENTEGVNNYKTFMEAFVAYHKYANPK